MKLRDVVLELLMYASICIPGCRRLIWNEALFQREYERTVWEQNWRRMAYVYEKETLPKTGAPLSVTGTNHSKSVHGIFGLVPRGCFLCADHEEHDTCRGVGYGEGEPPMGAAKDVGLFHSLREPNDRHTGFDARAAACKCFESHFVLSRRRPKRMMKERPI